MSVLSNLIIRIIKSTSLQLLLLVFYASITLASTVPVYYDDGPCWSLSPHCPGEEYLSDCSGSDSNGYAICLYNNLEGCYPGHQYWCPYDWSYDIADSALLSSTTATLSADYLKPITITEDIPINITATASGASYPTLYQNNLYLNQYDWVTKVWGGDIFLASGTSTGTFPWTWVPSQPGRYSIHAKVRANYIWNWDVKSPYYYFDVRAAAPLSVTTTSLPEGRINQWYSTTLLAAGGVPPYTWECVFDNCNGIGPGLTFSSSGVLQGVPTSNPGVFTVRVSDSQHPPDTALGGFYLNIYELLTITSQDIPSGYIYGTTYYPPGGYTLDAAGGVPPYNWSISSGSLPAGLSLSTSGVLSGIVGSWGTFNVTVKVADSKGGIASKPFAIITYPPITITTNSLPNGTVNKAYSQTLTATGGYPGSYCWSESGGSLPPGLNLGSDGVLSGTPTTEGSYIFTLLVGSPCQGSTATATKQFTVNIGYPPISIVTATLSNGVSGTWYNQALSATGGDGAYVWSVSSGNLPAGLYLDPVSGIISGVINDVGSFGFSIQATDSHNTPSATASYSIAVANGAMQHSAEKATVLGCASSPWSPFGSTTNLMSGILAHDQELFSTKGASAFGTEFSLFYKSQPAYNGPLGIGWSHTYDISLTVNTDGTAVLQEGNGSKSYYTKSGSSYVSPPGDFSTLVKNGDNSYDISYRDGHRYAFNSTGRLTAMVDRFSNTSSFSYTNGDLTSIVDPSGRSTTIAYNTATTPHRIRAVTDPNGNVHDFSYQGNSLYRVTYPAANAGEERGYWEYQYHPNGLLKSKRDPNNNITQYSYYANQRMQASTDPEGIVTSIGHTRTLIYPTNTNAIRTTTLTEKDGGQWLYTYDVQTGVIKQKTDPNGKVIKYYYYPNGFIKAKSEPKDETSRLTTFFTYDSYGNVLSETEPSDIGATDPETVSNPETLGLKIIRRYTYDNANYDRLTSVSDERGTTTLTTTFAYTTESGGEVISATATPGNYTTVTKKNPNGTVRQIIDANLKSTTFTYYPDTPANRIAGIVGLLESSTDPAGITTTVTSYDKNGNPLTVTVKNSDGIVRLTTIQQHNTLNRIKELTKTATDTAIPVITTNYSYDFNGNLASLTDAERHTTSYEYNYNRQVIKVTDAKQNDTVFTYSGSGCGACGAGVDKLIGVYDANVAKKIPLESQPHTVYQYDLLGRLDTETDPLNKKLHYTYYDNGQLKGIYDATASMPGTLLATLHYNNRGQLTDKIFTDGTAEHYTYTVNGQLQTAGNQNISYTYDYYIDGRLKTVTDTTNNRQISYDQYDGLGQRKQVTVLKGAGADQRVITYDYDGANRPWHITSTAGVFTYLYDTLGRRDTLTYPNGIVADWDFDDLNRLTSINHKNGAIPFASFSYSTIDKVGNRIDISGSKAETYGYDELYRLLTVTSTKPESFTFNAVGNRQSGPTATATGYQYNDANQMTQGQQFAYIYDNRGNQTTKTMPGVTDKTWTRTWDYNNRIVKEEKLKGSNERRTITYKYDPFGRRIEKKFEQVVDSVTETETTTYVYDNEDIVLEIFTTDSGTEKTWYTHGLGIDEPLALERQIDGGATNFYFYHQDGLGSITHITDAAKGVVQSYEYESYGRPTASADFRNTYTWQGREYEWETETYYFRNRTYDFMDGNFTSRDPLGYLADDINLYRMVSGNVTNKTDPFGLWDKDDTIGLGTAIVGLINNARQLPKSPTEAGIWSVDTVANKTGVISAFVPSSKPKSYADVAIGLVGTATALAGESPLMALLAGYSLGSAINNIPIGDSTVKDKLSDFIWKRCSNESK